MQYVNNDMDDLFRRAAENYPLDTKSADWDKIAAELDIKPGKTKDSVFRDRRFLWLLLLLPLSFLCNHIFNEGSPVLSNTDQNGSVNISKNEQGTVTTGKDLHMDKKNVSTINQRSINKPIDNSIDQVRSISNSSSRSTQPGRLRMNTAIIPKQIGTTLENGKQSKMDRSELQVENHEEFEKALVKDNMAFVSANIYPSPVVNLSSIFRDLIVKGKENKLFEKPNGRQKKIYAGIIGGIDATTIKFQKVSNAGYSFGILLGYKLNDKWSIESGLFHDKKYYYSEGQYLNTAKMYILPGTKINSLDGNCSMWEMPLQARYNFKYSKKKEWFSTLGLSSYFMKKENYDYTYSYISTGQTYDKYRSYNNASKHFFSVITLSAGFTNPINNTIDLRVEPYLKIPVKGVGVGSISLQSAGIQIGVTKSIF
jgi:hypothetical protein